MVLSPLQQPQPAARVQSKHSAVLQYSRTPLLRVASFEDEDDDEDEDEAPCEGGGVFDRYLGLKPQAESLRPFGTTAFVSFCKISLCLSSSFAPVLLWLHENDSLFW